MNQKRMKKRDRTNVVYKMRSNNDEMPNKYSLSKTNYCSIESYIFLCGFGGCIPKLMAASDELIVLYWPKPEASIVHGCVCLCVRFSFRMYVKDFDASPQTFIYHRIFQIK